jgi:hypothetical protein
MECDRSAFLALVDSGRILFPQCDGGPFHKCGRWCRTAKAKDPSDREAADAATARNAHAADEVAGYMDWQVKAMQAEYRRRLE